MDSLSFASAAAYSPMAIAKIGARQKRLLTRHPLLFCIESRRLAPVRPRQRHAIQGLRRQSERFGGGGLSRIDAFAQFRNLPLDLDARLLTRHEFARRILARRHPLLFESQQPILSGCQPRQQDQAAAPALPLGQRRCQFAAHGPGLVHQLQTRIAGIEAGDLDVQPALLGRAQQPIQTDTVQPWMRIMPRILRLQGQIGIGRLRRCHFTRQRGAHLRLRD